MKTIIITEGGRHIGFGHIARCISLCQALGEKKIETKFVVNGDKTVESLIKDRDFYMFDWTKDRRRLSSVIKDADAVVVDSYLSDLDLYEEISNTVEAPLYIDDFKRLDYPRGAVLNSALYTEELNYPDKDNITYLLGPEYALLRKEFWLVPEKEINNDIRSIMITFGAVDKNRTTPKVLELLNMRFPRISKKVIIGKGFNNIADIDKLKRGDDCFVYDPSADEMRAAMLASDMSISAGGQTLYELARIGIPTVSITAADNQLLNTAGWHRKGFAECAGRYDDKNLMEKLLEKISIMRDYSERLKRNEIGKSLIDGKGAGRVAKWLLKQ
ncbi:MAG: UDP-2,4-diacetamido-2,4,6-trideoxy-beta-L-altropyranose hydrolase [Candidatus Omnitrophica bacterium]|nr:UDP-2,4-diacetamido-2,4,6-trideoxy-beta-L-altropyranose hydrolase [Candidatus Omnitrophota bacterium]